MTPTATLPPTGHSAPPGAAHRVRERMPTALDSDVTIVYQPILDIARGTVAGYQAQSAETVLSSLDARTGAPLGRDLSAGRTAATVTAALAAAATLPANTFLSVPVGADVATDPEVLAAFGTSSLGGLVLDIVGFAGHHPAGLEDALERYRAAGALISVGGHGTAQPELTSIVALKPAIIRLGRDWVRGIDGSELTRSTVELIGRLAGQLDAWVLCEGVTSAAELRTLAGLGVPLAQGPFIGDAQPFWPGIDLGARVALPKPSGPPDVTERDAAGQDGGLQGLVQQVYTSTDLAAAASMLPETSGFDVVVIVDDHDRPLSMLESGPDAQWRALDVLAVNVATPVADVVSRAMARPRRTRFAPLVCTDDLGHLLGIVRIEQLMTHLAHR